MAHEASIVANGRIRRVGRFGIALLQLGFATGHAAAMDADMEDYRWKNRVLFIFAPDTSDPRIASLKAEIASRRAEVDERDLVVYEITQPEGSTRNGTSLTPQEVCALRSRFLASPEIVGVRLIGKDGGVKLTRDGPVHLDEIFGLIDSMPMRKEEMRRKGPGN